MSLIEFDNYLAMWYNSKMIRFIISCFAKNLGYLYWEMVFQEHQGCSLVLGWSLCTELGNKMYVMCMSVSTHLYKYVCIYYVLLKMMDLWILQFKFKTTEFLLDLLCIVSCLSYWAFRDLRHREYRIISTISFILSHDTYIEVWGQYY